MKVKRNLGLISILALTSGPMWFWATALPPSARFATVQVGLGSLAVLAGQVGLSAFALNLVLGARIRSLEAFFGSLDRMYRIHRRTGIAALILLLTHPLLIAWSRALSSLDLAAGVFLPDADLTLNLGRVSGIGLIAVVSVALFVSVKYEVFVLIHKALGPIFALAVWHAFRIPGTKALSRGLTFYLLALSALGLGAWSYRGLLGRILVSRTRYRVSAVNLLSESVVEIVLDAEDKPLKFLPGQFAYVRFKSAGVRGEPHPFSLTSAPGDPRMRLMVKSLGDFTESLLRIKPGAVAELEGPFGAFSYRRSPNRRHIWIAGGLGITPFLSMARSVDAGYEIDFYYCTETADQAYYLDELFEIADRNAGLRVIPIRRDSLGYVSAADIEGASKDILSKDVWICGPPGMTKTLTQQFRKMGIPAPRIHTERFDFK